MTRGKAPLLSHMEWAILGSLHEDGPANLVEFVERMHPSWGVKSATSQADVDKGIAASLICLRDLQSLSAAELVTKNCLGTFSIKPSGVQILKMTRSRKMRSSRTSLVRVVGSAGVALHLGSCSILSPGVPPDLDAVNRERSLSYAMQQFRDDRGAVQFRACASDCEQPTKKTLVIARQGDEQQVHNSAPKLTVEARPIDSVPHVRPDAYSAPTAHYRVYFRFGTAELGPGAVDALSKAIPELRAMDRIDVAAGADPVGTKDKNLRLVQRRQESVKAFLVRHGVNESRVRLGQTHAATEGVQLRGMPPRQNELAEMRRADMFVYADAQTDAKR